MFSTGQVYGTFNAVLRRSVPHGALVSQACYSDRHKRGFRTDGMVLRPRPIPLTGRDEVRWCARVSQTVVAPTKSWPNNHDSGRERVLCFH